MRNYLWTSECVGCGHPDKVADQISDAILDECLKQDPKSRVACETLVKDSTVVLAGEITTAARFHYSMTVEKVLKDIGYWYDFGLIDLLSKQSPEIGNAVTNNEGAGDQGIMFGYAKRDNQALMPMSIYIARDLVNLLYGSRKNPVSRLDKVLLPDCKTQVTLAYNENPSYPKHIDRIVVSTHHLDKLTLDVLRNNMVEKLQDHINKSSYAYLLSSETKFDINPAGLWTIGGPIADCGLTGRKVVVDGYGADCEWGGGALCVAADARINTSIGTIPIQKCNHLGKTDFVTTDNGNKQVGKFYANGEQDTIKLVTNSGYELEATPEHLIRVIDQNGGYVWKMLKDITQQDYIPIQRKDRQFGVNTKHEFAFTHQQHTHRKLDIEIPSVVTPRVCELMGLWTGDSNGTGQYISLAVGNQYIESIEYYKKLISDIFKTPATLYGHWVQTNSLEARAFLEYLGCTKHRAWDKEVPEYIWSTTKENVAAFLRGCFETDGHISTSGKRTTIAYTSTSKKLTLGIQQLLLNFGIISSIQESHPPKQTPKIGKRAITARRNVYILVLKTHNSLLTFKKEIGFCTSRKQNKLYSISETSKDYYDGIPNQLDNLRSIIKRHGLDINHNDTRFLRGCSDPHKSIKNASYFQLKRFIASLETINNLPEIEQLIKLLDMGHYYDTIKSISNSRAVVYDINVPENHTFTANGFIVHNSGKDPTKVDRSAAYMARYIAKNLLHNYTSLNSVKVQLAYVIGKKEPASFRVMTDKPQYDSELEQVVKDMVDLTPRGIIERFQLTKPIYFDTAQNGHFGIQPYIKDGLQFYPWEKLDLFA